MNKNYEIYEDKANIYTNIAKNNTYELVTFILPRKQAMELSYKLLNEDNIELFEEINLYKLYKILMNNDILDVSLLHYDNKSSLIVEGLYCDNKNEQKYQESDLYVVDNSINDEIDYEKLYNGDIYIVG